jgi:hypothetical protein
MLKNLQLVEEFGEAGMGGRAEGGTKSEHVERVSEEE